MDLFEKVVRDYVEMGGGCLSLTPVVGEAFLDKRLVDRIRFIRRFPEITSLSLVTNAVMTYRLSDDDLRFVVHNFNQIYISIYGIDDEEYRAQTKKNTYLKMIEGIRRILRCADGGIQFGFRFLKEHSNEEVQAWIQDVCRGTGYSSDISFGSTREYANWSIKDTSSPLPFGALWSPTPVNTRQCAVPFFAAQILVNGNVSFCSCPNFDDNRQLSLGNVREASLLDILNNELSHRLWNWAEYGVPDFCRSCSFHAPIDALPQLEWIYTDPVRQVGG